MIGLLQFCFVVWFNELVVSIINKEHNEVLHNQSTLWK